MSFELEFNKWLKDNPEVAEFARQYPPNHLYRLKETGQLGHIIAYDEGGTVRMYFGDELNKGILYPREVYGIDPTSLEIHNG